MASPFDLTNRGLETPFATFTGGPVSVAQDLMGVRQPAPGLDAMGAETPPMLAGTPSAAPIPPERQQLGAKAMQFFMSKGLSPEQAAGLAGNFAWESGGRSNEVSANDNLKHSPNSPHSAGIGQWNDRLPALIQHARDAGIPVPHGDLRNANDVRKMISAIPLDAQLEFAWKELQGSEGRSLKRITDAKDVTGATMGAIGYHRPAGYTPNNPMGGHGFAQRLALAHKLLGLNAAPQADPLGAPPMVNPTAARPTPSPMAAAGPSPMRAGAPQPQPTSMGLSPDDLAVAPQGFGIGALTPRVGRAANIDEATNGLGPDPNLQPVPVGVPRRAPSRPRPRARYNPMGAL